MVVRDPEASLTDIAALPPNIIAPIIVDLSNNLAVAVFQHTIETALEGTIRCRSYVSRGLVDCGQSEIIFTLKERNDQPLPQSGDGGIDFPTEPLHFIQMIQGLARDEKKIVYAWDSTQFGAPDWLGRSDFKRLVYLPNLLLGTLGEEHLPSNRLHAIAIISAEEEVVSRYGLLKVISQLGRMHRHFPCPPWIVAGADRQPAVTTAELEGSMWGRCRTMSARSITGTRRGQRLIITIGLSAQEGLKGFVKGLQPNEAWAIALVLDREADSCLTWKKADTQKQAIGSGTQMNALGILFIGICPQQANDALMMVEDGFYALITDQTWEALRPSLEQGKSIAVSEDSGNNLLQFDWVADSYVSPVDGNKYAPTGGFKEYHPTTTAPSGPPSPEGPIALDHVVILREPPSGEANVENMTKQITDVRDVLLAEAQAMKLSDQGRALVVDLDFGDNGTREIRLAGDGMPQDEISKFETALEGMPPGPSPGSARVELHFKLKRDGLSGSD